MRDAFAKALRSARKAHGFTQEDLADVSSRTYVSILERGQKSPTLNKMNDIADAMGIHLMSLIALTHLRHNSAADLDVLLEKVRAEVIHIQQRDTEAAACDSPAPASGMPKDVVPEVP